MARKIYCKNIECKFHRKNDICNCKNIIIGFDGCESFEKGFSYYFHEVWRELGSSNFILCNRLTEDVKIGIYYILKIYNLNFEECEWGDSRFVWFKESKDGKPLTYKDIVEREMNDDELNKLYQDFMNGKLPNENIKKIEVKKEYQPFGWLSPTGVFTEGDFGDHEKIAYDIIDKKGFREEYKAWKSQDHHSNILAKDFLVRVKGYVLIHNPSNTGAYNITYIKKLTKHQNEFLYQYFIDMGDKFKAESFIKEA